ncbi:MAG: bile acid:sodium symporter family protein [Gammaproteobacteria bacterium]|nr:bile acid:sodium symporter family protein [Gammaproteobacteria bacterium]
MLSTLSSLLIRRFPYIAIALCAVAVAIPEFFIPARVAIVPLLGLVMFGMGMTLRLEDFKAVARRPRVVGLGVLLQFTIMPFAAWLVALAFGLPPQLAAGMVLVGAGPGGTASNVICYLARGDVALSITLTAVSTVMAIALTPFLTWLYVGQTVPVPVTDMLWDIARIVLLPVFAGVAFNTWLGHRLGAVRELFPAVSVLAIVAIIAIIVALNAHQLGSIGLAVVGAVMVHNLLGLGGGYWVPRLLGHDARTSRTLAIEVGMQNSGLGVALAIKHFSPLAALPGAVFSIWHNLSGAALAAHWARRPAP